MAGPRLIRVDLIPGLYAPRPDTLESTGTLKEWPRWWHLSRVDLVPGLYAPRHDTLESTSPPEPLALAVLVLPKKGGLVLSSVS